MEFRCPTAVYYNVRQTVTHILLLLSVTWAAAPGLDLHELASLASFVRHFAVHQQTDAMTLADFLDVHYGADAAAHQAASDPSDHADLPLKGHGCTPGATVLVEPAQDLPRPLEIVVSETTVRVTGHPTHLPGPTPFQPPRP